VSTVRNFDYNLLSTFSAMMEEKNVKAAAKKLSVDPTTVSKSLGRLREVYNDELFVRDQGNKLMNPTERAISIYKHIGPALDHINSTFTEEAFVYNKATTNFRIIADDYYISYIHHRVVELLHHVAPEVTIDVIPIHLDLRSKVLPSVLGDIIKSLKSNETDLVIHQDIGLFQDFKYREITRDKWEYVYRGNTTEGKSIPSAINLMTSGASSEVNPSEQTKAHRGCIGSFSAAISTVVKTKNKCLIPSRAKHFSIDQRRAIFKDAETPPLVEYAFYSRKSASTDFLLDCIANACGKLSYVEFSAEGD